MVSLEVFLLRAQAQANLDLSEWILLLEQPKTYIFKQLTQNVLFEPLFHCLF